ncbi:MAG: hypothetical protein IJB02_00385 [Oscillospiraceae bacterium]|nr:hypothetical protein [Oscillospiraceae bacterium]
MYSNARLLSMFAVILGAINAVMSVLLMLGTNDMNWTEQFTTVMFLLTNTVVLLLLAAGLRSATTDLTANDESTQSQIRALKKKVDELDAKSKY